LIGHVAKSRFTGLRAERKTDLLRHRGWRADHCGHSIEKTSDRIEILFQLVVGERLDQHASAVFRHRGDDMLQSAKAPTRQSKKQTRS